MYIVNITQLLLNFNIGEDITTLSYYCEQV